MSERDETNYWLLPCAEDARSFKAVIDGLAAQQGGPSFRPHMTLGAVRGSPGALDSVIQALAGLTLQPTEIDQTDRFTMSLFVRFELSDALKTGRAALEAHPDFRPGRLFDPHISLCYGKPVQRELFEKDISALLSHPVRFDRLVAMHIPLPVATYDDIRKWREIETFNLPMAP